MIVANDGTTNKPCLCFNCFFSYHTQHWILFSLAPVNSRRSETSGSYGEVGAEPEPSGHSPAPPTNGGATKKAGASAGNKRISSGAERDKNLLLSSDDEFQ